MPSLLSSLALSGNSLDAFNQALQVMQNNVANVQTPGYAKQTQSLAALPFDPALGTLGGVHAGVLLSSRDEYAEQAVRTQAVLLGQAQQNVSSLTGLQSLFDISGNSGIPNALNQLFQSASAWGQLPNDANARQTMIQRASDVASAFQQTAGGLATFEQNTDLQLQQTVTQVNQLVGQLQTYNKQVLQGDRSDSGLDAQIHSTLEQLSQYVDFTATKQADGSTTVLLNGQTSLLVEDRQYNLSYQLHQPTDPPPTNVNGPPLAQILASDGTDVTSKVTTGQLGALLNVRNTILPTYIGDAYQSGSINTLAKQFADRVNQLFTSGNVSDGPPPVTGVPLFTYDAANATNVAQTLAVDPTVGPDQLAAITPGPPEVANGIPLALSQLSNPQNASDQINGESYVQAFGDMAARAGSALSDATNEQQVRQAAVTQAQNLRQQSSGVSLDEEAVSMVEFQRAYEANSRLVTVLAQLTEDTINMLPPA